MPSPQSSPSVWEGQWLGKTRKALKLNRRAIFPTANKSKSIPMGSVLTRLVPQRSIISTTVYIIMPITMLMVIITPQKSKRQSMSRIDLRHYPPRYYNRCPIPVKLSGATIRVYTTMQAQTERIMSLNTRLARQKCNHRLQYSLQLPRNHQRLSYRAPRRITQKTVEALLTVEDMARPMTRSNASA
jgi:hypothetical protein